MNGMAARDACRKLRAGLAAFAALKLGGEPDANDLREGARVTRVAAVGCRRVILPQETPLRVVIRRDNCRKEVRGDEHLGSQD